jgi:hypothetical protein
MRLTKKYADGSFGVADSENSHEFKKLCMPILNSQINISVLR